MTKAPEWQAEEGNYPAVAGMAGKAPSSDPVDGMDHTTADFHKMAPAVEAKQPS
jgi:hypothetical protein